MQGGSSNLFPSEFQARSQTSSSSFPNKEPIPTSRKAKERLGPPAHPNALVVDDVADVTEMLSVLLTHAGYHVVTAASAMGALKVARERQFDVIISDIGMPEMNGYQLARELRMLPGYESIPMVAVTGYSMFDDKE
ncbi:MAG TPA: response regulator, partial [Pyrinomonadaceae bacterium]|nr:response regulator [Pyrinomonadaceae bacterium]